jgi:hypothetical protein
MRIRGLLFTGAATALLSCGADQPDGIVSGPTALEATQTPAPAPTPAPSGPVVFAEDFESGSLASWPDGVNPSLHRVVNDPAGAQSGRHYLSVSFPSGRDGGWLTRFFMPGYNSLRVSYYVRLSQNWRGGTKLIGFYGSRTDNQWSALGQAGKCPQGSDFFAAMVVTEPTSNPGPTRFYTYYPGMAREPDGRTCYGRYGDGSERYTSLTPLSRGVWHRVELAVQLNTPGQRNAREEFWIDGELRGSWSGFSFGDTNVLRLNAVQLTFSVSGGVPGTQEMHVDNLVVRQTGAAGTW